MRNVVRNMWKGRFIALMTVLGIIFAITAVLLVGALINLFTVLKECG